MCSESSGGGAVVDGYVDAASGGGLSALGGAGVTASPFLPLASWPSSTARRQHLKFARHWPWTVVITEALARLEALPSPG